ncbi:MAG: recombinase RecA [Clostridiaceae bacterium]|jgi:recombination protein RecA|nr:recombinase RecA [Clostridiaceae bacterium]HZJ90274.1 recombinase RecA [Oscillospiraceae bacterium]
MARKSKSAKSSQDVSPKSAEERERALKAALNKIEKEYGKGAVQRLGDSEVVDIGAIPTGSLSLDLALGIGGVPRGRIVEIYGPESSGKTTVALHMIAEAQKLGGVAAFIDAEHALDPNYAEDLGVDIDNLIVSQPDYGEQALEICEDLARSGAIDIIVIDSVAALVPRAEIDGEMGDASVGLHARLMSQAMRKLAAILNKSNTTVIFINQLREKIGIMFGNPETTTGGRALKFYSSVRLDVRRIERIMKGDENIGNRTRVRVVKNKVAPPFKEAEFDLIFGKGISRASEVMDLAVESDVMSKSGSWYSYGETRLGNGRDAVREILEENEELLDEIEDKVRDFYFNDDEDDTANVDEQKKAGAVSEEVVDDVDDILGLDL